MAKLLGKAVGDTIVEFYGPITGRNYNIQDLAVPIVPRLVVQVFGTGAVQVEETVVYVFKGNDGLNVFTRDRAADQATWSTLGAVVDEGDGQVTENPAVDDEFTVIRVIVETAGEGQVVVQADWS